ncbi:Non-reducing polyketide synthase terA [Mycena sanguinolenta]|uniref:Non-reducing polyketide synthase terA n=1 Tax=Mycena sanguinolenta TaxID=230812 RepID=A0A8H7DD54_9AGAR|nr:Non-reducing polyketide synthase terA [Mycena sanguinolenta]
MAGIDLGDFKNKDSLLNAPGFRYHHNPIISGTTLFLFQSLRYLNFVEASAVTESSLTPFSDVLGRSHCILGFSSGILPACVVSSSSDLISYISCSVQAFRIALWIGVRTQIYRATTLIRGTIPDSSWSLVVHGISKNKAEELLQGFHMTSPPSSSSLYITAVTSSSCVTISGRPDLLNNFAATLGPHYVVQRMGIDTLYHSLAHANGARLDVLTDISRRGIKFPDFPELKVPIRSSFSGDSLTARTSPPTSLVELVIDMILTQPVNWDLVMAKLLESLPDTGDFRLLNFGPGTGLLKTTERAFPHQRVRSVDATRGASDSNHVGAKQEPIAIVGMAVNMPGAPNAVKLWEVLENGINTVSEIPEHRFKVEDYDGRKYPKRQMKTRTGNFLDNVDEFDHRFFKISPREAKSMDPQQRILLQTAYEALEDSGYVPNTSPTSRPETFGCYIGVATEDYVQNIRDEIDVYYSTGTLRAFLSGRISFAMQLSGPSVVVDTACSSSNVAVYLGARALMNGDCDSALVGGVNTISSPDMFLGLDRGHFLNATGQCKSFDASADGYSRSEGCGVFVLKRLRDAIAENDNIRGVIRGIEVNQSGLAHSITYPHAATQAALFRKVLETSGIDPNRVNVVEAHGTGTQAGDPNEVESVRNVFAVNRAANNPLHITSVKANIGHLEAASGVAGLAKLLLMLHHRVIPRQISFKNLHPLMTPLENDNTIIDRTHAPWLPSHEGMTRIALLNNFGAAGSNTALLLEEYLPPPSLHPIPSDTSFVFGISAKTLPALQALRTRYIDWLHSPASQAIQLADIAYTATARRQIFPCRLAVSACTREQLIEKLGSAAVVPVPNVPAQAIFVFSGQGSQYLGMGRRLYRESDLFRRCIDECEAILTTSGFLGVLPIILGTGQSGLYPMEEFEVYQVATFALEYALAELWVSWNLIPAAVVGHSLGEYAALVTAGVLTMKDALLMVARRARLMVQKCPINATGMLAVNLSPNAIEAIICELEKDADLTIACYNTPLDCVVSGTLTQLNAFKAHLDSEVQCKSVLISVPFGYHSPTMSPLQEGLTAIAKRITFRPPTIPIISNVLGDVVLPGDASVFTSEYFARHCTEPVHFDRGIRALMSRPEFRRVDAWVELGPHTTSLSMLRAHPALPRDTLLLPSLHKHQPPSFTLAASLVQLYASNFNLRWRATFAHLPRVTCVSLPSYPFEKTKFWVPFRETASVAVPAPAASDPQMCDLITEHSMLHRWVQYPAADNDFVSIFETPISQLSGALTAHRVGGMPLCPASVYLELVFAGIELSARHLQTSHHDSHVVLRRTEFEKPLVYNGDVERTVVTRITFAKDQGIFTVSSRFTTTGEHSVHIHGEFKYQSMLRTTTKFLQMLPLITRQMAAVVQPRAEMQPEVFSTNTAYNVIFPRVVDYAPSYYAIQSLTVDASGMEGCATIQLPSDYDRSCFVVHPVWMDTLLHIAGFMANLHGGVDDAYICTEVGAVKVFPALVNNDKPYLVYCSNAWLPDEGVMIGETYAVQIAEPNRIVAHMKGIHFRRVRLTSLKKSLAHAAGHPSPQPVALSVSISGPDHESPTSPTVVEIEAIIRNFVYQACDIDASSSTIETDLPSIGVDSMMAIEILGGLRAAFPEADLDARALSICTTIADICREVDSRLKASADSPDVTQTLSEEMSSLRTLLDDSALELDFILPDVVPNVVRILSSVLDVNVDSLGPDADLDALGMDSMAAIEVLYALKAEFGFELPNSFFTSCSTPHAIQAYISSAMSGPPKACKSSLAPLIPGGPLKRPVLLESTLSSPDSSFGASLERITTAFRLDTCPVPIQPVWSTTMTVFPFLDRPIWGIHNPRFIDARPWDGMVDMAAAYVEYVLSVTSGPLLLGGWSFGGVAAYEMALQLTSHGIHVKGILLIDSPSPIDHTPLSDALIDAVIELDAPAASCSELAALVKKQFVMNARMLGKYVPHATASLCPPLVLLRSSEGFHPSGVADVPTWLADRSDPQTSVAGWQSLAHCSIKVIDIPGNHFKPFHPSNITELSLRITDGCEYLEGLGC